MPEPKTNASKGTLARLFISLLLVCAGPVPNACELFQDRFQKTAGFTAQRSLVRALYPAKYWLFEVP